LPKKFSYEIGIY